MANNNRPKKANATLSFTWRKAGRARRKNGVQQTEQHTHQHKSRKHLQFSDMQWPGQTSTSEAIYQPLSG